MGTYTDVTKVKSLFRRIKIEADTGTESTNTVITTEEVDEFITEQEAIVNARLSSCYDMTSVGVESIKIIGVAVKYKVASVIQNIMALSTSNSHKNEQTVTGDWALMAIEMLDKICPPENCGEDSCVKTPTMPLPDTALKSRSPESQALFKSNTSTPQFKKDTPNW